MPAVVGFAGHELGRNPAADASLLCKVAAAAERPLRSSPRLWFVQSLAASSASIFTLCSEIRKSLPSCLSRKVKVHLDEHGPPPTQRLAQGKVNLLCRPLHALDALLWQRCTRDSYSLTRSFICDVETVCPTKCSCSRASTISLYSSKPLSNPKRSESGVSWLPHRGEDVQRSGWMRQLQLYEAPPGRKAPR